MSGRFPAIVTAAFYVTWLAAGHAVAGRILTLAADVAAPCSDVTLTPARFGPPEPTADELAGLAEAERAFARLDLAAAEQRLSAPLASWREQAFVGPQRLRAETLAARLARVRGDAGAYAAAIEALGLLHLWLPPDPAHVPPDLRKDIESRRQKLWESPTTQYHLTPLPTRIRIGVDAFPATSPIELPTELGASNAPPMLDYEPYGWLPWPTAGTAATLRPLEWSPALAAWVRPAPADDDHWLLVAADGTPQLLRADGQLAAAGQDQIVALLCSAAPASPAPTTVAPAGIGTTRATGRTWYRSGWLWSGLLAGAAAGLATWALREDAPSPAIEVRW
jgi:hypothetical protein